MVVYKSVNFNLQDCSNVVPTDSHVYFTALVKIFSWENLACTVPDTYPKYLILNRVELVIESNLKLVNENRIMKCQNPVLIASVGNPPICAWPSTWCTRNLESFYQSSTVQSRWSWAHFMHCCRWCAVSMGTWLGRRLHRFIRRRLRWTVSCDTLPWSPLL